jgi:hypothetical protein
MLEAIPAELSEAVRGPEAGLQLHRQPQLDQRPRQSGSAGKSCKTGSAEESAGRGGSGRSGRKSGVGEDLSRTGISVS